MVVFDTQVSPAERTEEREQTSGRSERPEECTALVPTHRPRRWGDLGPRLLAAACYFSWLGYVTAVVPLLLVEIRALRRSERFVFHAYVSAGWSVLVAVVRTLLIAASVYAGARPGESAEALLNALNLANIVVVLTFALLLSLFYGVEALLGRDVNLPGITTWARRRAAQVCEQDAD